MLFEQGDKIVFIGDSVTDCGRAPEGEGRGDEIGRGYVGDVAAIINAQYPEMMLRFLNKGTNAHQSRDLLARWQQDVLALQPQWVSVMIGINDVWRQFDMPTRPERHVGLEEYQQALETMLTQTLPHVKGMLVLSPFFMEPNRKDPMRAVLDTYGGAAKAAAQKHGAVFVDVQAKFDSLFEHLHPCAIAWDRVHPNQVGHMVIAGAVLEAIGFSWNP